MRTPVEVQIWRMSVLVLLGIAADAIFQFYTAFRSVFNPRKIANHVLEFFMGLLIIAGFAAGVFITSWGEIRSYIPITIGIGYLLGEFFVGKMVYYASRDFFLVISKALRFLRVKVLNPVRVGLKKATRFMRQDIIPPSPPWPSPNPPLPPDSDELPPSDPPDS
jgi:hypothetical protein